MSFLIQTGRFESGTEEQQFGFRQLFGEDVQRRFDLYFHWYNIIHELGHCFVSQSDLHFSDVQEEMFVNEFAVAYYLYAGETRRLAELKSMVQEILAQMPSPVPEGETFTGFYERIWHTDDIMQVMIYGYFQFRSVLEALEKQRSFESVAADLGFELKPSDIASCDKEVSSENADTYLLTAKENMQTCGMDVPQVRLQLMDDPTVQCVRWE